ncbi:hypothetical protein [Kineococcus glutinatus]
MTSRILRAASGVAGQIIWRGTLTQEPQQDRLGEAFQRSPDTASPDMAAVGK